MNPRFWCGSVANSGRITVLVAASLLSGAILASCGGSNRSSVEGYTDIELNEKRVFVLLPVEGGVRLTDPAAFAWSRGIAETGAAGRVYSEFRTRLTDELDARYDSNTVHNFATQSVGATNPLDPDSDFRGEPSTWDWRKIEGAMKVAAIDYLVVLSDVVVRNESPRRDSDRGRESVQLNLRLIDLPNQRLLLNRQVEVSIDDPRVPSDTYVILARELAESLPFFNRTY